MLAAGKYVLIITGAIRTLSVQSDLANNVSHPDTYTPDVSQ